MEHLTVNLVGKVRQATLDGRQYLVAPLSMIAPGVLNGSQGPILYRLQEMQESVDDWNGMPITVNHPNGVSARSPEIWEKAGIGHVYGTKVDNKLIAEGWFDVLKTQKVDNRIYLALRDGTPMELSTGLRLQREDSVGVWNDASGNSVEYTGIAKNYKPDHLAILPDQQGACGIKDGCGMNVANEGKDEGVHKLFQKVLDAVSNLGLRKGSVEPAKDEETHMGKLTDNERSAIVTELVTNCDCWKGKTDILNKSDDDVLKGLKSGLDAQNAANAANAKVAELEPIANAAKTGVKIGDTQLVLNEKNEWVAKAPEPKPAPVVNNAPVVATPENVGNRLTVEEREAIEFGKRAIVERKNALVDRLVANHAEDKRAARAQELMKLSYDELADRVADLPAVHNQQHIDTEKYTGIYSGLGAGQVFNRGSQQVNPNDAPPTPLGLANRVWNYENPLSSSN